MQKQSKNWPGVQYPIKLVFQLISVDDEICKVHSTACVMDQVWEIYIKVRWIDVVVIN